MGLIIINTAIVKNPTQKAGKSSFKCASHMFMLFSGSTPKQFLSNRNLKLLRKLLISTYIGFFSPNQICPTKRLGLTAVATILEKRTS